MRGFGGVFGGHAMLDREEGEERSGQHLDCAGYDPAGTGADHGDPPCALRGPPVARQKPQEVDLFADLRHQREHNGRRGSEQQQIEMSRRIAVLARKRRPFHKRAVAFDGDGREGQNVEQNPERLGP